MSIQEDAGGGQMEIVRELIRELSAVVDREEQVRKAKIFIHCALSKLREQEMSNLERTVIETELWAAIKALEG